MKKKYYHLTSDNRTVIKTLLQENNNYSYIADFIGVHRPAICREIKRNSGLKGYRVKQATRKALARKEKPRYKKHGRQVNVFIIEMLNTEYSPEQISGISLRRIGVSISAETIYKFVIDDKQRGGRLYKKLRINGKRRRKNRIKTSETRGQIKHQVSIDSRPMIVDSRKRLCV